MNMPGNFAVRRCLELIWRCSYECRVSKSQTKNFFHENRAYLPGSTDLLCLGDGDALRFDLDSVKVENITEWKEYHGLHIAATAYLDKTRVPVSIDIGFGDIIYPSAMKIEFPVIFEMEAPIVNAYSMESAIAEKLEAIIHNGYLNSRYKDFYDICILTEKYSFSYDKVKEAVVETFQNRGTALSMDTAAFGLDFIQDSIHQNRWKAFLKKKKALEEIPFEKAILTVKNFAEPLLNSSSPKKTKWSAEQGIWL